MKRKNSIKFGKRWKSLGVRSHIHRHWPRKAVKRFERLWWKPFEVRTGYFGQFVCNAPGQVGTITVVSVADDPVIAENPWPGVYGGGCYG